MNPLNTESILEEYRRARASLLAEYPELAFDSEALSDSLDGITDAPDLIAKIIREHLETVAQADGLGGLINTYNIRRDRMQDKADALKAVALRLMQAIGERSIKRPEFTLSISASPPSVKVTDPDALPALFKSFKVEPDKQAIAAAIKGGSTVPGAVLSNGGERLSIRVK